MKSELYDSIEKKIGKSPSGNACKFVALNEKWAVKMFRCPRRRDETKENQELCYSHGWAPEVGESIDLPKGYADDFRFGYYTEIVETACPDENTTFRDINAAGKAHAWELKNRQLIRENTQEIWRVTGWQFKDNHEFNWGYKDGKLIPIDFGLNDESAHTDRYDDIEEEMLSFDDDELSDLLS